MNLFVSCVLLVAINALVPAATGTIVLTATAGTILAVAGIAALAKAKGLAVGAAAGADATILSHWRSSAHTVNVEASI